MVIINIVCLLGIVIVIAIVHNKSSRHDRAPDTTHRPNEMKEIIRGRYSLEHFRLVTGDQHDVAAIETIQTMRQNQ